MSKTINYILLLIRHKGFPIQVLLGFLGGWGCLCSAFFTKALTLEHACLDCCSSLSLTLLQGLSRFFTKPHSNRYVEITGMWG